MALTNCFICDFYNSISEEHNGPIPVEIKLHKASRILEVEFDDGKAFSLPCETVLRVGDEIAMVALNADAD
jgi:hypothetical protein